MLPCGAIGASQILWHLCSPAPARTMTWDSRLQSTPCARPASWLSACRLAPPPLTTTEHVPGLALAAAVVVRGVATISCGLAGTTTGWGHAQQSASEHRAPEAVPPMSVDRNGMRYPPTMRQPVAWAWTALIELIPACHVRLQLRVSGLSTSTPSVCARRAASSRSACSSAFRASLAR